MNNNLALFFVIIVAIIFIAGIILMQKPETKKTGLSIIVAVAVLVIVRYFYLNYDFVGIDFYNYSSNENGPIVLIKGENIATIFSILMIIIFAASPVLFLLGLILALISQKYRKNGVKFMIFALIGFIISLLIGLSVCSSFKGMGGGIN